MDVLILRVLLDISFYLSVFMPLIRMENPVMRWGLVALLALWVIWLIMNWKARNFASMIQDMVFLEIKVLAVVQVFELVAMGLSKWQDACGPFVLLFLVTAILLLRAGRLAAGNQGKGQFWSVNSLEFGALLGTVFVLSSETVRTFVWNTLGGLYMKGILPVLLLILDILEKVLWFIWPLLEAIFSKVEYQGYEIEINNQSGKEMLKLEDAAAIETPEGLKILGLIIAVAAVVLFLRYMAKRLSESGGAARKQSGEIRRSTIPVAEKKAQRKLFDGEKNVRYYYRKFLELCRKHGMDPEDGTITTEAMYRMAADQWKDEEVYLRDLRSVYLDIRYGGKKEDEPDRKLAKTLYKKIKEAAEK